MGRTYPFELHLYFRYVHGCAYIFVSLLDFFLHARFDQFCFSCVLISLYCILALDANFSLTVSILISLPILLFVQ